MPQSITTLYFLEVLFSIMQKKKETLTTNEANAWQTLAGNNIGLKSIQDMITSMTERIEAQQQSIEELKQESPPMMEVQSPDTFPCMEMAPQMQVQSSLLNKYSIVAIPETRLVNYKLEQLMYELN